MKTKLNLWLSRDLTIYGKSLLAKALGISQLVYAASMLTVPESVVKVVQENLFAFLWKNRERQNWCTSTLVHWYTGTLVHWYTSTLVH